MLELLILEDLCRATKVKTIPGLHVLVFREISRQVIFRVVSIDEALDLNFLLNMKAPVSLRLIRIAIGAGGKISPFGCA